MTLSSSRDGPKRTDASTASTWAEKKDGKLVYAGKLEHGFSDKSSKQLLAALDKLKAKKPPITAHRRFPKAHWVQPRLMVDADFRGKTPAGLLRHPSFKGVRRDLMES